MASEPLWESDIIDWDKISVEAYKSVIEQAKERLNEVIQESDAITRRGMTILIFYLTILSGLFGYVFSETFRFNNSVLTYALLCVIASLSIYVFTFLFILILPKKTCFRGSPPKEIFLKDILDERSPEDGLKALMYNEVERIQNKIESINMLNKTRTSKYRSVLKVSLIYIVITILTLMKIVFTT